MAIQIIAGNGRANCCVELTGFTSGLCIIQRIARYYMAILLIQYLFWIIIVYEQILKTKLYGTFNMLGSITKHLIYLINMITHALILHLLLWNDCKYQVM